MAGSVGGWFFCWWWTMGDFKKSPCTKPSGDAPKTPDSWSHIPNYSNDMFIDIKKTWYNSNDFSTLSYRTIKSNKYINNQKKDLFLYPKSYFPVSLSV